MKRHLVKVTQVLSIPLFNALLLVAVARRNIQLEVDDINQEYKYVIVSNHRGAPDPFVIGYGLGSRMTYKITPVRFFTQNRFFRNPLLIPFLHAYGCFPARHEVGKDSGLKFGIKLLRDDQTILIFPEGKVSRFDNAILPKTGVEHLADEQDVLLIPARVRWNRKRGLFKSYSLSVGKPFSGKNMTAEQIMDVVYSLKFS